jgi:protein ImuA
MHPVLATRLEALRAQVDAIQASGRTRSGERLAFGIAEMDRTLSGGLAAAALHEVAAASATLNDDAAASLFVAGIAARLDGTILWVMSRRDLFAPALAQAGLPPGRIVYAECSREEESLAVIEEGVRHAGLAAVIGETGRMTMTTARRLQLAAEASGTMALLLRRWRRRGADPLASPSAAMTRWRIGCFPSRQLPVAGIARPRWQVELARQRGGPGATWILEGVDEAGRLALPAEPRDRTFETDRSERQNRRAA